MSPTLQWKPVPNEVAAAVRDGNARGRARRAVGGHRPFSDLREFQLLTANAEVRCVVQPESSLDALVESD